MIKGIVRKLDALGRVTLPVEMRKSIGIKESDPVDIYFKDGVICIKAMKLQCVCCGITDEDKLVEVEEVLMCPKCIKKFSSQIKK